MQASTKLVVLLAVAAVVLVVQVAVLWSKRLILGHSADIDRVEPGRARQ